MFQGVPPSLGQSGVQQPQGPPHQVQAPSDQDTDGSRLPQQHGPAAGSRVRVSTHGCCQVGVPALRHPSQRLRQAGEHQGWGIEGPRGWGHEEQGPSGRGRLQEPPDPQWGWEPGLPAPFLLQQPCPGLLVLQAAGEGVLHCHVEVLLVCEGWGQGLGESGMEQTPAPQHPPALLVTDVACVKLGQKTA